MQRIVFNIAYKGSNYHGWQIQPSAITVQEIFNANLDKIYGETINCVGCGRTDAGVHASDFYLHYDVNDDKYDEITLKHKLNRMLPKDIAIHKVYKTEGDFHTRFTAEKRGYVYAISNVKDAFGDGLAFFFEQDLDVDKMNEAASKLLHRKHFESFCKAHSDVNHYLCDVFKAEWRKTDTGYEFYIEANRFLRNMVRAIVGTMIDIGLGKTVVSDFEKIIEANDRSMAGTSAPAQGLYLAFVGYPKEFLNG